MEKGNRLCIVYNGHKGEDIHLQPITLIWIDCRHTNLPQEGERHAITLMESRRM